MTGRDEGALELAGKQVVVVGLARSGVRRRSSSRGRGARGRGHDRQAGGRASAEALRLAETGRAAGAGRPPRGDLHRAPTWWWCRRACPGTCPSSRAARAAGVRGDGGAGAGLPPPPRAGGGGHRHQGQVHHHRRARGHAARGRPRRARGRQHRRRRSRASSTGPRTRRSSCWRCRASSSRARDTFHPRVAVFLNLSADHLDRHASFEEYAPAKARIFANQTSATGRWSTPTIRRGARPAPAGRAWCRSLRARPWRADSAFFEAARLSPLDGRTRRSSRSQPSACPAPTSPLDLLAAAAAARLLGAPADAIARAVRAFRASSTCSSAWPRSTAWRFFNDSKATNVDAARKSLEAFDRPVLVILGGRYKGGDFADLRRRACARRGQARDGHRRGARPRGRRPGRARVPVVLLRHAARGGGAGLRRRVARATSCCWPPPARRSTCSRTTPTRGRAFKDEVRRSASRERGGRLGG